MRVTARLTYEGGPGEVFAMLVDEDFQDRKLRATGALRWDVDISGPTTGGGAVVRSTRELPTDRVPDPFRSAVGQTLTLVQTETWDPPAADGSRSGRLELEVRGAPIRLTGTLRLTPTGTGTEETVDGDLKARVPLVGGRIEKAAEPAVRAAIDAEQQIGRDWLAGSR